MLYLPYVFVCHAMEGTCHADKSLYPVGRINSIIYPVDGGMEDWMYAAGWDPRYAPM